MVSKALWALVVMAAAGSAIAGPWPDARARDLLLKSMERSRCFNVSAILTREGSGGIMQLKLEQSEDGFERQTILQPLSMQGVSTVDDGKRWMTLWPDERRVLRQDSPRLWQADPEDRIRLADRNYRLTITSEDRIAGRRALCVSAVPRSKEMATRRYYLDERTGFILRSELVDENGEVVLLQDTKAISFPDDIPKCCEMISSKGMRVMERTSPMALKPGASTRSLVGFEPVLPGNLPFGFVIHAKQIIGDENRRYVAVRITDGLVSATIYQYKSDGDERKRGSSDERREAAGVGFRVVGELTSAAKSQILSRFLKEAEQALGPSSELRDLPPVLVPKRGIGS